MKLARNLTVALVLGILIVLAFSAYVRVRREAGLFENDIRRDDHTMGRALAAAVLEVWRTQGEGRALHLVNEANERESQVDIRWVWLDAPARDEHGPRLERRLLEPVLAGHEVVHKIPWSNTEYLVTCLPVPVPSERQGALELSESLAGQRDYVRATIVSTGAATAALTVVSAIITAVLGLLMVGRPMRALTEQARRIGAGDLSRRLALGQSDEIGQLAEEMNGMCDRLAAAQEKLATETAARIAAIEQLRHAERLATVGKLASGVAHELGAPIQIVMGRAGIMAEGDVAADEIVGHARIIVEQGRRMTRIIRQLLDFARRRTTEKGPADLRQIVKNTCTLLTPLADKQRVRMRQEDGDGNAEVEVDAEQVQQALTNVVINGIQAMPSGGNLSLAIRAARVRPPADHGGPEDDYVAVQVDDEGHGMAPETVGHVFEPFFTTKPVGEGTGLGLSVAYGIVREHGGWIDVESRVGSGSRFTIYLPRGQRS